MPVSLQIDVTYAARRPWAPRRSQFKCWAEAALLGKALPQTAMLSVRVVGSARSRSLNARYRHKNNPTNVLSFAGAGTAPDGSHHLGELVICAPVVAQEARRQGKTAASHWAHMTVHGVLHLLGFDHERAADARKMSFREIQILDQLGFPDPYV